MVSGSEASVLRSTQGIFETELPLGESDCLFAKSSDHRVRSLFPAWDIRAFPTASDCGLGARLRHHRCMLYLVPLGLQLDGWTEAFQAAKAANPSTLLLLTRCRRDQSCAWFFHLGINILFQPESRSGEDACSRSRCIYLPLCAVGVTSARKESSEDVGRWSTICTIRYKCQSPVEEADTKAD